MRKVGRMYLIYLAVSLLTPLSAQENPGWLPREVHQISYPRLAQLSRVSAEVKFILQLDDEGNVISIALDGHPLFKSVGDTLKKWKFRCVSVGPNTEGCPGEIEMHVDFVVGGSSGHGCSSCCSRFQFEYPSKISVVATEVHISG